MADLLKNRGADRRESPRVHRLAKRARLRMDRRTGGMALRHVGPGIDRRPMTIAAGLLPKTSAVARLPMTGPKAPATGRKGRVASRSIRRNSEPQSACWIH
jgi:hypothetical protein